MTEAFWGGFEKQAIALGVVRGLGRAGKAVVKHPMKTLGAAGTAMELQGAGARGSDLASGGRNIMKNWVQASRAKPKVTM